MATAAAMPKTIILTSLPTAATNSIQQNFVQLPTKIGTKRSYSIISTSPTTGAGMSPISLALASASPSPPTNNNNLNQSAAWLPATVQRTTYKYETLDDDDYEYGDDDSDEHSQYANEPGQPPRKRERLTHLSAEEKMFRRKMKNRIAAQTARDRKKALMIDLEETVRRLEEENDTLVNENAKLRHSQTSLADENDRLKKLLTEKEKEPSTMPLKSECRDDVRTVCAFGPAESINVPLPKEQAKSVSTPTWSIISVLIQILSNCCGKSSTLEEERLRLQLQHFKENESLTLEELRRRCPEGVEKLVTLIRTHAGDRLKPP